MNRQILAATVAIAIGATLASCGDQPTAPSTNANLAGAPADASARTVPELAPKKEKPDKGRAALLTNVPVTGVLGDGGTFAGRFTATHVDYDAATKSLVMTGTLTGTATTAAGVVSQITQQFTAPMTLAHQASSASVFRTTSMATCDILFLDLAPLHLDLLGLTVDLSEVVLDLNAVSGAGNLLGNLLCAVVGLLDGPGLLASISHILDTINNILSGLTVPAAAAGASWALPSTMTPGVGAVFRTCRRREAARPGDDVRPPRPGASRARPRTSSC